MKTFLVASLALFLGIWIGFEWNEKLYAGAKLKFLALTDTDIEDYLRIKKLEEKYKKADEILGKALLILLMDLGLKLSEEKVAFAKSAILPPSPLPSPLGKEENAKVEEPTNPLQNVQPPSPSPALRAAAKAAAIEEGPKTTIVSLQSLVSGTVTLTRAVPKPQVIRLTADPMCRKAHGDTPLYSEELVVGPNKGLKNAVVYMKRNFHPDMKWPLPPEPVLLDQRGCQYIPHAIAIRAGQKLQILNSDPGLHNVHALPKGNVGFNQGMATKGLMIEKVFEKPEMGIRIKCDVHGWMSAFVSVFEHPFFAVTDETGAFNIKGLPPGTYTLEAWHEKLGVKSQNVVVENLSTTKHITFAY